MLRSWATNIADWMAGRCLKRAQTWLRRSAFWSVVAEWLDSRDTWSAVRARYGAKKNED